MALVTRPTLAERIDQWEANENAGCCVICGHFDNHDGQPHGTAVGDGVTRLDVGALPWLTGRLQVWGEPDGCYPQKPNPQLGDDRGVAIWQWLVPGTVLPPDQTYPWAHQLNKVIVAVRGRNDDRRMIAIELGSGSATVPPTRAEVDISLERLAGRSDEVVRDLGRVVGW